MHARSKSYAQTQHVLFLDGSYIMKKVNVTFSLSPSAEPDRKVTSKIRWPVPQVKEGNDSAGYMLLLQTLHHNTQTHPMAIRTTTQSINKCIVIGHYMCRHNIY